MRLQLRPLSRGDLFQMMVVLWGFSCVWSILLLCFPSPSLSTQPLNRTPTFNAPPSISSAGGTSFLTHDDLSIWGEVIHLARAHCLGFSSFILVPWPTPSVFRALLGSQILQSWVWEASGLNWSAHGWFSLFIQHWEWAGWVSVCAGLDHHTQIYQIFSERAIFMKDISNKFTVYSLYISYKLRKMILRERQYFEWIFLY